MFILLLKATYPETHQPTFSITNPTTTITRLDQKKPLDSLYSLQSSHTNPNGVQKQALLKNSNNGQTYQNSSPSLWHIFVSKLIFFPQILSEFLSEIGNDVSDDTSHQ